MLFMRGQSPIVHLEKAQCHHVQFLRLVLIVQIRENTQTGAGSQGRKLELFNLAAYRRQEQNQELIHPEAHHQYGQTSLTVQIALRLMTAGQQAFQDMTTSQQVLAVNAQREALSMAQS